VVTRTPLNITFIRTLPLLLFLTRWKVACFSSTVSYGFTVAPGFYDPSYRRWAPSVSKCRHLLVGKWSSVPRYPWLCSHCFSLPPCTFRCSVLKSNSDNSVTFFRCAVLLRHTQTGPGNIKCSLDSKVRVIRWAEHVTLMRFSWLNLK
jgi:hypothetical protein